MRKNQYANTSLDVSGAFPAAIFFIAICLSIIAMAIAAAWMFIGAKTVIILIFGMIWLQQAIGLAAEASVEFIRWLVPPFSGFDAFVLVGSLCIAGALMAIGDEITKSRRL